MLKNKKLIRYDKLKIWKLKDPYPIPEELNLPKKSRLMEKIWYLKKKWTQKQVAKIR